MEINKVRLLPNPDHINKFLTHWTGRKTKADDEAAFHILKTIVESKELKFGLHNTSFPSSKEQEKNTMICFTDTPIRQSLYHCIEYGFFGISFNKSAIIEYGASPVLYIVENRRVHREEITKYSFQEPNLLMTWFSSVSQPYDPKEIKSASYFHEREWRIIRKLTNHNNTIASNNYPFQGTIRPNKVENSVQTDYYLKFDPSIIENIIVKPNYCARAVELVRNNNLKCEILLIENPHK
jgi:hypothetical protein